MRRIWGLSALYAVVYFALGVDRYVTFHAGADLGLFTQSIAGAFHGFANTQENASHLTFHFSPLLYVLAPAVWLTRSALALTAIQAVAVALTIPALFALARRSMDEGYARLVALVAFFYPPLAGVAFTDFHENAFVPALSVALLLCVAYRRFALAALCGAALLAAKEDQALIVAFAAACAALYFYRRREMRGLAFAAGAFAVSLATFGAYFAFVREWAGARTIWQPLHFYVPGQPGVAAPAGLGKFGYALEALVPLAFVPLLSPAVVLALPGFAEVLLSRDPLMYTMGQHYAAVWAGYLLAAFVWGCARLAPRKRRIALYAALGCSLAILLFANPLHPNHFLAMPSRHSRALEGLLSDLPPAARVGTYDEVYAHLGFDPQAHIGIRAHDDYLLFDETYDGSAWLRVMRPQLQRLIAQGAYVRVATDDGATLYRRASGATTRVPKI